MTTLAPTDRPREAAPAPPRPSPLADAALAEWSAVAACPRELLVGGRWRPARSGRTLAVEDPSTGEALCAVADASAADALDALATAHDAQAGWAAVPARDRARILRRAADELERRSGTLAMLITLEMGKPLAESADEVAFAREYLEWCAEEAVRVAGTCSDGPDGSTHLMTRRHPVGPCLIITPWNFPLAVPARGVAAALAAGCTVILRPSALTPLSALALGEILQDSGVPAGVLNVIVSSEDDATDPLMADGRLRKLTFTGSTAVGRHLIARSADRVLRVSVELGGQAPFIVLADADLDAAVDGAMAAKMRNGGEACTAANHFYVDRAVADEFTARLTERLAVLAVRRGTDAGAQLGPMVGERQRRRLSELVDDARACGATIALAGGPLPGAGHFFAPVVLTDVPDEARVMREEIVGPIAPIRIVDGEADAIEQDQPERPRPGRLGVHAGLDAALRMGDALEVGMVAVNRGRASPAASPFCGVKQSGFGQAGGAGALDAYLETRVLSVVRCAARRAAAFLAVDRAGILGPCTSHDV